MPRAVSPPPRNRIPPTALELARNGRVAGLLQDAMQRQGLTSSGLGQKVAANNKNPSALVSTWIGARGAIGPKYREPVAKALGLNASDLAPDDPIEAPPLPAAKLPPRAAARPPAPAIAPKPPAPLAHRRSPLSFTITADGQANITLDITTDITRGKSILRMLLDVDDLLSPSETAIYAAAE